MNPYWLQDIRRYLETRLMMGAAPKQTIRARTIQRIPMKEREAKMFLPDLLFFMGVFVSGVSLFLKLNFITFPFLDHKHSHCRYRQKRYESKGFAFFVFAYLVDDTHYYNSEKQPDDIRRKSSLPAEQERKGCG